MVAVISIMSRCIDNKAGIEGLKVEFLSSRHASSKLVVHNVGIILWKNVKDDGECNDISLTWW